MLHFKGRPSAATVLAFVALIVALSGSALATPVAKIARQITGADIKNGTIKGADIKNGSLSGVDIHPGSIGSGEIGANAVKSDEIAPDSIGGDKVKPDSLDGSDIIESRLGQVPSAANADTLQGHGPGDFLSSAGITSWNIKANQGDDKTLVKTADLELHAVCDPAGTVPSPQDETHYYIINVGTQTHGQASESDSYNGTGNDGDVQPGDNITFNYTDAGDTGAMFLPNGASLVTKENFVTETSDPTAAAAFGGDCAFAGSAKVTTG